MKLPLRQTARLNIINYFFVTLLLVACTVSTSDETTIMTPGKDRNIASNVTAELKLNITTPTADAATITPTSPATPLSLTVTPLPLVTSSLRPLPTLTSTPASLGGWLVFESAQEDTNGDGAINSADNIHIYSLNLSTNELVQLTYGEHKDVQPSWSPDRREIVFASNRNGNPDLYIINADGSNIRQLTKTPENETTPIWTLDGQQIIYVSGQTLESGLQESHLYTISINGENNHLLISLPGNSYDPDLSSDGRFLAYTQEEPIIFEGETRIGTVVYIHDMQSDQNFRITTSTFESDKGQFHRPKWLPRRGWYLSMIQVPGDLNPSGLKVFELTWTGDKPILRQVLEFDEGPGGYTWGNNGEWLISANNRTILTEEGKATMTTDLSVLPITIPQPQTQLELEPARQISEHILQGEGDWLTNDVFYKGSLDWSPD